MTHPTDTAKSDELKAASAFMKPYADAGHDIESLFRSKSYRCAKCGAYQIDLSEDLMFGEMRKCVAPLSTPETGT